MMYLRYDQGRIYSKYDQGLMYSRYDQGINVWCIPGTVWSRYDVFKLWSRFQGTWSRYEGMMYSRYCQGMILSKVCMIKVSINVWCIPGMIKVSRYSWVKLERMSREWAKSCLIVKLPYCQYKKNYIFFSWDCKLYAL